MTKKSTIFYSFLWLVLLLAAVPLGVAQEAGAETPPLPELNHLIQQSKAYPEIERDLNLANKFPKILRRIREQNEDDFLVVDEERVQKHFEGLDETELRNIRGRWGLQALEVDRYLSIPFFVTAERDEPGEVPVIRFVVSRKLPTAVASRQLYYRMLLRTYAALPNDLKSSPSAWTHGLASLAALDMMHLTSLVRCPDLPVETTLAALLIHNNPDLLSRVFPDEQRRFSSESYQAELRRMLRALGSADPDGALEQLLRSPEEYYAIEQSELMEAENAEEEEKRDAPLIHPDMRILWMALPDEPVILRGAVDSGLTELQNSSLQAVYLNAVYDKLCALIGEQKEGMLTNSGMLLTQAARDDLGKMGVQKPEQLLKEFETRREQVWGQFKEELNARGHTAEDKKHRETLMYDPMLLKWTFRFLYNYSLEVRKAQDADRQEIEELEGILAVQGQEKRLRELVVENPDMILDWWKSDSLLAEFFKRVGYPELTVTRETSTKNGIRIDVEWTLRRYGTEEQEKVRISIVDPMTGGDGRPKEGVEDSSKVIVRRAPGDPAEVIELGDIQRNFWVRTVGEIGPPNEVEADWARVVGIGRDDTERPWKIASGAEEPLVLGRAQLLYARFGEDDGWGWKMPNQLRGGKDLLFGIQPEGTAGAEENAQLLESEIAETQGERGKTGLTKLTLSYRDTEGIMESGAADWGYFANARLVHARVQPAPVGVDGEALIELPQGTKRVDALHPGKEEEGEAVSAFNFGSPETFMDWVQKTDSMNAAYYITFSYALPDGAKEHLRVAEGQRLVVFDRENRRVETRRAYQMKAGQELVCGFGPGGRPVTAKITDLEAHEAPLGAYTLTLTAVPLVRINGVLIPVRLPRSRSYPGVDEDSWVQLSPPLDVVRSAETGRIDLSKAEESRADNVGSGALVLSFNVDLEPIRTFNQLQILHREDYAADQYLRIVTDHATLDCGREQGIFRTRRGWDVIRLVPAHSLQPGDKVVWLDTTGTGADSAALSPEVLSAAIDRAGGRARDQLNVDQKEHSQESVRLIPVLSVEKMFPTEARPKIGLCAYLVPEDDKTVLGYKPNLFANGILVSVMPAYESGNGNGGGRGDGYEHPGPEERAPSGREKPGYKGVARDVESHEMKVSFSAKDKAQIERNRSILVRAFRDARFNAGNVRQEKIAAFLGQYFTGLADPKSLYSKIDDYLAAYLQARDFLVGTVNAAVLPALVNEYVFLATLTYEAGGVTAGDALTQDFLDIMLRVVHCDGKTVGERIYATDGFLLRSGLKAARDIVLYVRDRKQETGLEPVRMTTFSAESFSDILKKLKKRGLHREILSDDETKVRLYHLCRQLDRWAKTDLELVDTFIAPGYDPSKLFQGSEFRNRLKITTKEVSDNE